MSAENFFDNLKKDLSFNGNREKEAACLKRYSERGGDGSLDPNEFHEMCLDLFVEDGKSFALSETESRRIFEQLDENQDNFIDKEEFHILWRYWLPMILQPKAALIAVDVQNDFIDGSLAVAHAEEIVPVINRILEDESMFQQIVYTFDWHPKNHVSFHNNVCLRELHPTSPVKQEEACVFDTVVFGGSVPMEQTLWPAHCVQDTHGAKLHADLKIAKKHKNIYKGLCDHVDSYSAFFDNQRLSETDLATVLCSQRITDVYVCGLAFDVCVRHTAVDAASLGFRAFVVEDAARGITTESCDKARKDMEDAGCIMVSSTQVKSMVEADTRNPKMALQAAVNVALARQKAKVKIASINGDHAAKPLSNGFATETASLLDL